MARLGDGMRGGGRNEGVRWSVAAAVTAAVVGLAACEPRETGAAGEATTGTTSQAGAGGGACVFVKPDGARKFGHVGWGFRITGTDRWVYGAVENPGGALYTPPGGDIGAWHVEGSYARMLSDMSRDAHHPGTSEHPYSRYRCTTSSTSDVKAARAMIRTVAERGFLVGLDPDTGEFGSRDCLDATHDILKAYRTRLLPPVYRTEIPNVWVESLVTWSDRPLTPH